MSYGSGAGGGGRHDWYYTGAGHAFTIISQKALPNGLMPVGPLLFLIIRGPSESTKLSFKDGGIEFKEGEVYTWSANGKRRFPQDAKNDILYLCAFDRSLSDKDIVGLFLKEAPRKPVLKSQ